MRIISIIMAIVVLMPFATAAEESKKSEELITSKPWIVYYSDKKPISAFDKYDLVVLDSKYHPPLDPLKKRGKTVLGYISIGEVEQERYHFKEVKDQGILLKENENWPGSFYVDMRGGEWTERVITELIPNILRQGFDGLILDTLDNPSELERENPKKYEGMKKAAVNLVKAMRLHYPDIKIMMNRGYDILPEVAGDIDMVLGESVYADYNFKEKTYGKVEKGLYELQVGILNDAKKVNPDLEIYTLDYWYPDDPEVIKEIYKEQRKNGFSPYVATIGLDEIIEEPN